MPTMTEGSLDRRAAREAIRRLFQRYVDDYGPKAGTEIIRALVFHLGGLRFVVPSRPSDSEACRLLVDCYLALREKFGDSALGVMQRLLVELKGQRITFPDMEELCRWERDEAIRNAYKGDNVRDLAQIWGVSPKWVRNIIMRGN